MSPLSDMAQKYSGCRSTFQPSLVWPLAGAGLKHSAASQTSRAALKRRIIMAGASSRDGLLFRGCDADGERLGHPLLGRVSGKRDAGEDGECG
jgi:hypothetical protein